MPELPEETQAEPLIGWKAYQVRYRRPYWMIKAGYNNESIQPADVAKCHHFTDHPGIPDLDCTCGFYAYKDHDQVNELTWLFKVALYGKVIVCEHGYRAEKQKILEVWRPERIDTERDLTGLKEQFPGIIWHTGQDRPVMPAPQPEIHVHLNGDNGPFDLLPKEIIDNLLPNQYYQVPLPIMKPGPLYALSLRVTTTNQGMQIELMDPTNMRIMGPVHFTGSKKHYSDE